LARLGPAVLFSAAIPGQGGTHHVNERWQDYWAGLFQSHGYAPFDVVRAKVWNEPEVAWWYAQNTLLYCSPDYAAARPAIADAVARGARFPLRVVHPRKMQDWHDRLARAAQEITTVMPRSARFLLIDDGSTGDLLEVCGVAVPFPQQGGIYAGSPADSASAIAQMRALDADYVVMLEQAYWWETCYPEWFAELQRDFSLVLATHTVKVFARPRA
jgi:hypothetical protein